MAVGPLRHLRSGRPWRHGLPGVVSTSLQALKRLTETISSLRPDPDGEEAGSSPQDGVGAVIGAEKRRDDAIAAQPDEAGTQQLVWQLGQQLGT